MTAFYIIIFQIACAALVLLAFSMAISSWEQMKEISLEKWEIEEKCDDQNFLFEALNERMREQKKELAMWRRFYGDYGWKEVEYFFNNYLEP